MGIGMPKMIRSASKLAPVIAYLATFSSMHFPFAIVLSQ